MVTVTMAAWRDGLWSELFDDPTSEGRAVSIIHIDDALFARAIAREGFALSNDEARDAFLKAFPERLRVQRWLVGSESPGEALLPLLILCCLAASEAADSDDNDYRGRMRDLMGWDDRIINCAGLPRLWSKLRELTIKGVGRKPTRHLILPDPRFRTQIGHAIELTFPSRNDTRRLMQELAGETFDLDAPRAVIAWLAPLVTRRRFSSTFEETFKSFQDAWLDAERALADHRFWSGWMLATQSFRDKVATEPFEVVSDEWGVRHLIDPTTETKIDLEAALRARTIAAGLLTAASKSHVIPLIEGDWGRLRWMREDVARAPAALLIRQRAFGSRYATLGCVAVSGAEGWGLTFDVTQALGDRGRGADRDRLLDLTFTGSTRVDGGVLARPALPFFVEVTGLISSVRFAGEIADRVKVEKVDARRWRVVPIEPVEGEVLIVVEPRSGGASLQRTLRLRRSILIPNFRRETPDRYFDPHPKQATGWPLVEKSDGAIPHFASPGPNPVSPALLDLIEYLAIRTSPLPLGGFIDIVRSAIGEDAVNPWDVTQALRDAGILKVLDVRGWRGRAVMSIAPRCVLSHVAEAWALVVEGCANETFIQRLSAAAERQGLELIRRMGIGCWAPETLVVESTDADALRDVALAVDAEIDFVSSRLNLVKDLRVGSPATAAPANAQTRTIRVSGNHAPITFIDTDRANAPPTWRVDDRTGARYWKWRDDAILDAYLSVGARPFEVVDGRVVTQDARLPAHIARWIRLVSGVAAGPVGVGYGYARTGLIARELGRVLPSIFGDTRRVTVNPTVPSRRWPRRAVSTPDGPRVISTWSVARQKRGGD